MCMQLSGTGILTGVRSTGFADDRSIAVWAKPYVSTALKSGVISGYTGEGGATFAPERSISVAEAAVMLDRAIGLTDAVSAWSATDSAVPAWAAQSAANLSACGLLPHGCSLTAETLSRAQCAEMLSGAMDVLARR